MGLFSFEAKYATGVVAVGIPGASVAYVQQMAGGGQPKVRVALTDGRVFETPEALEALGQRLDAACPKAFLKFPISSGDAYIALSAIYLVEQSQTAGPTVVHLLPSLKAPQFTVPRKLIDLAL